MMLIWNLQSGSELGAGYDTQLECTMFLLRKLIWLFTILITKFDNGKYNELDRVLKTKESAKRNIVVWWTDNLPDLYRRQIYKWQKTIAKIGCRSPYSFILRPVFRSLTFNSVFSLLSCQLFHWIIFFSMPPTPFCIIGTGHYNKTSNFSFLMAYSMQYKCWDMFLVTYIPFWLFSFLIQLSFFLNILFCHISSLISFHYDHYK